MQLFQVKEPNGTLVMNAPLEAIRWILKLPKSAEQRLLTETVDLNKVCQLHFNRYPACGRWNELHLSRLPLEIPFVDQPRPTNPLGDLLCDQ